MKEHEPFIAAIEAHPEDTTTRLVYADWLDERNHPASEYLRAELRLAPLPEGSEDAPELQAKLRTLRQRIEPAWLARFDQPRVMLANPTPFPAAWWAVELPGVRNFNSTYHRFAYETLPPLRYPPFTGNFDWLPRPAERRELAPAQVSLEWEYKLHFDRLTQHLTSIGLALPPDFIRWMTDLSVWRIPSCTDCHITRSWDVALVDGPAGGRVLPFYVDSQDCITWYLYLTPEGFSAVVATGAIFCSNYHRIAWGKADAPLERSQPREEPEEIVFVAPSVEAFFYRWWLENTLWHKLVAPRSGFHDPTPFTAEEQAYVDFYRQRPAGGT